LFMPSIGAIFSMSKFEEYTFSDGQFKSNNLAGLKWTFGIKTYPFKTNIRNTEFILWKCDEDDQWYRRNSSFTSFWDKLGHSTFIYVGADPTNITKDFQLGAGVDLWSGVSLNLGVNFMIYEENEIWRNTVSDKVNR